MAKKEQKQTTNIKKEGVEIPTDTAMDKFHKAMKKIVSAPKLKLKDK